MRNFLYKISARFNKFMQGRNGTDRLARDTIWIYLAVIIIGLILGSTVNSRISTFFYILSIAVFIFYFYRIFSKNLEARRRENEHWLNFINNIKKRFRVLGDRFKYRKTYVFRYCPKCRTALRLKKIRGKHMVTCPHCNRKFYIHVI